MTGPQRFRKKPVVITAIQWTGDNYADCLVFVGRSVGMDHARGILIETIEGVMTASVGDWIIKGVKGEFYPCKPDIFDQTYEPAGWTTAEMIMNDGFTADMHMKDGHMLKQESVGPMHCSCGAEFSHYAEII